MPTVIDTVQLMVFKYAFTRHSMMADDRFGNPDTLHIPIAMAFGDQDFVQSEGAAEVLIERNPKNQLFKIERCGHGGL